MAVDYLKNYLNIDPNDYSAMQSRIAGTPVVDDQFARRDSSPSVNSLRNFGMPQQRSLGDIEAMQLIPRQQPAPQPAPQVDDRYQGLMDQIAALRSQIDALQAPTEQVATEQAPVMAEQAPVVSENRISDMLMRNPDGTPMTGSTGQEAFYNDDGTRKVFQAPVGIENRAVGEPQPIPQAPAEDIQASINYLAGLPKMNIPQIPDMEEIKRKMAEANMNFPEPISYPDQLQSIRNLPPMNQMPTREEIQMAMQNMPTPTAPVSSMPKFNLPQMQSFGLPQQIAGGRTLMSDFSPRNVMRMASGGGIDQAIYDLKFKLNG
jgi:hypothetical protein